jgi:type IV fimbrial biogenesis protein FimT
LNGVGNFRGFTLIEVLVALAIIFILALVSIPSFINLIQSRRLSTAAEQLYNTLQYARTEAIKRNANVYVSFITGDSWCYGVNLNSACNCSIPNNCGLGSEAAPESQKLSLTTSGLSGNSIYFESTHAAANAAGSITYTVYGGTPLVTISVGRLGNLQMCSNSLSEYTSC